jgi:hypothetical protein
MPKKLTTITITHDRVLAVIESSEDDVPVEATVDE